MRADREFFGQFAVAKDLDAVRPAIGQTDRAQSRLIHPRAVVKPIQFADVHHNELFRKARVVESTLGNTPDERHLATFKADADGAARTRRLAFAATTARFAMAAGFTLAEPFARMLCARAGFQIM